MRLETGAKEFSVPKTKFIRFIHKTHDSPEEVVQKYLKKVNRS